MEKRHMIISIGRECGSGGHEIGEKLAAYYGIKLYDRNLIELLADRTGEDAEKLAKLEEKVRGGFLPIVHGGFSAREKQLWDKKSKLDRLYLLEKAQILSLAEEESFVIIGRGANAILKDDPNTIRLYVYASEEFKTPRVKAFYHLDTDREAVKKMRQVDRERRNYFNYYSDSVWGSSDAHDFMIDSSAFGIDDTVEIIKGLVERKFGKKAD